MGTFTVRVIRPGLGCVVLSVLLLALPRAHAASVEVAPGEDIQSLVDLNPEGTTFVIKSGIHRLQTVVPKNNCTFIGEPGAVMSGARVLTSFAPSGNLWVASDQTQEGQVHGVCDTLPDGSPYDGCRFPEDLYLDDQPLFQVLSLAEVVPGTWYFDYAADQIYLADNPAGRKVEVSVTRHAFRAQEVDGQFNVKIQSLTVEKYACPAQHGAIHARDGTNGEYATNWQILDCEVRLNHGVGIKIGREGKVLRNYIHHNGQLGIGCRGDDIMVAGNELAHNNYARHDPLWESGGIKFTRSNQIVIRNNYIHDNQGAGIWSDISNINVVVADNVVAHNTHSGIFHEIGYDAVICNNAVKFNGAGWYPWLYGSNIQIANSNNTEVFGNTVEVASEGGNGIGVVQQDRGTGAFGPHLTFNNYIHDNDVTHLDNSGRSGAAADFQEEVVYTGNNVFDFNTYHVPNLTKSRWHWRDTNDWDEFRANGQEPNGFADTLVVNGNQSPVVYAGYDQVVFASSVDLRAAVTDNQAAGVPGAASVMWSLDSGPGTAVFDDATAPTTSVSFSATGTYCLRLTADDGERISSDVVTITSADNTSYINGSALIKIQRFFGVITSAGPAEGDYNFDGFVNGSDLIFVQRNFGKSIYDLHTPTCEGGDSHP